MENISLVIADDHPLLLKGLEMNLTSLGYKVYGTLTNGKEAVDLIEATQPHLAILDVEMPEMNGLSVAKHFLGSNIPTKFIILSYLKETSIVARAESLNISGYLLKEDALDELEVCIEAVISGGKYFSDSFHLEEVDLAETALDRINSLTPSEKKILKLIARDLSTKEMAEMLFVSERTIEKHRSNIIQKLAIDGKPNGLNQWAQQNKRLLGS